jgi:hypothetical protein
MALDGPSLTGAHHERLGTAGLVGNRTMAAMPVLSKTGRIGGDEPRAGAMAVPVVPVTPAAMRSTRCCGFIRVIASRYRSKLGTIMRAMNTWGFLRIQMVGASGAPHILPDGWPDKTPSR